MEFGSKGGSKERDADIFISYQRGSADKAKKLAEALRRENRDVFIDVRLGSDAKWRADIERKLERARCVVTVWSKRAATSGWVNYEAFRAQQEGKLIAVSFDAIRPDDLPNWLTDQQITDLRGWRDKEHLEHDGWLNISRAVHAKCAKLPEYKFKGWLGSGPAHERVTSLAFHPTEDARLMSSGFEGGTALWLASHAEPDWRGAPEFDPMRPEEEWARHGQLARQNSPPPEKEWHRNAAWRVQFSHDGSRVVVACRDGIARVFDSHLGNLLGELRHNQTCGASEMGFLSRGGGQHRDGVLDASFAPNGDVVTVGGSKAIVWAPDGTKRHASPIQMPDGAPGSLVRAVHCDLLDGFIIGDKLGKVRVLDHAAGEIGFQIDDRDDTIVHIALGPSLVDGRVAQGVLAIVSQSPLDAEIKFHTWNRLAGETAGAFTKARPNPLVIETPPIRAIAMHPNAPVVAVASNAVQAKLFDHEHNEAVHLGRSTDRFGWHDNATSAVAFSATGKYLAVGSDDGRISVWENRAGSLTSGGASTAGRNRRASDASI